MLAKIAQLFCITPKLPSVQQIIKTIVAPASCRPVDMNSPRIAVQVVPNSLYFGLMAALLADLKAKVGLHADAVVVRSTNAAFGFNLISEIKRSALLANILMQQWIRSFGSLLQGTAYFSSSWTRPIKDCQAIYHSYTYWKIIKNSNFQKNYSTLKWNKIIIGDLLIDTYLRFKPNPRFNINDIFVWRLLWQIFRDYDRANQYFEKYKPIAYLTSYATYLDHGIACRVALKHKIAVYSFGTFNQFGKELTIEHDTHTPNCINYQAIFSKLGLQQKLMLLEEAKNLLSYRLNGGIDPATSYMHQSAYSSSYLEMNPAEFKDGIIVFLHDFYDSPHVWQGLLFTDFWEWIVYTIEALEEAKIPFYIKPHPNQIKLSDVALRKLKEKYPHIKFLDANANNKHLVAAGIRCGVTVFGSIAHELAYLGVPCITAAIHSHISFQFCLNPTSKEEYKKLLKNACHLPPLNADLRKQALEFYVIHNNLHAPQEAETSNAFLKYWMASAQIDEQNPSIINDMIPLLVQLRETINYKKLIQIIANKIIYAN